MVAATLAGAGCTTMRSVDSSQLAAALDALRPGERVSVLTPRGWHENHYVVANTPTGLELKPFDGEHVTVERADIWELQLPTRSRGKTAALVGGIAAGAWLLLLDDAGYELDF